MDSARLKQIQVVFLDAAELPEAEQPAFLKAACGDDEALMNEVLAMLREDAQSGSLLDGGVAGIAHQMLGRAFPNPAVASELGPYRLRTLLGEGGMGVVYLAEREDLGSLVAIKFLRDAWLSPIRRERFESERRTLAQLNHPSIARLYDADTLADGTPWFVMEYVDGVPLTAYCHAHGCSITERLTLFRSVAEAVRHAHSHAVIHRDLKPSNILVKSDGAVRLLDFGIAKHLDRLDTPVHQTRTHLRLLTPAYAAPEQIRGEPVGIQTDVYSLGVILYELLAGRPPFDLTDCAPGEAEMKILNQEPEKPTTVADLDVLCLTAMHKDLRRRYQSVEGLIRDIDHYLKGEPLEARPDTLRYRLGKFVSRNRRAVAAAGVAVAAVLTLVVFFTVRLGSARNAALAQAARTQRIRDFMLNLFEGGDKEAGPAGDLRVVSLIDRGVQEARSLDAEPAVQAELYQTLGSMYQKMGKFDRADALMNSALERRASLFGPDSIEAAESRSALGLLRVDQSQFDAAERLVRDSLDRIKRAHPQDNAAIAKSTFALGKVLEARGAYAKAIPVLEDAVKLQSAPGPSGADLAASLTELANSHFYAGHYDVSESLDRRVLAMHRQLNGDRHPLVADDLINLGAIQFERGRYPQAEQFYRQALEIEKAFYGQEHYQTASNLTMLGSALVQQKRYDEAVEMLQRALAIRERVYGPQSPRVAFNLSELGKIARARGRLDEAERDFRRMVDIYRAAYNDRHYLIAVALGNLGDVYVDEKQYGRAEQTYRDAVRRSRETLPPAHQNIGIQQIKLGHTLLLQNRYREAEAETRSGFNIVTRQTNPQRSWLEIGRRDLRAIYVALNEPEKARQFEEH